VLAAHVVRGLDGGPQRRPPQHHLARALAHEVGQVREPAGELLDGEVAFQLGQGTGQESVQRREVDLFPAADRARPVDEVLRAVGGGQISTSTP
jgi:hypothetical protein